jgi:hypothetical protein
MFLPILFSAVSTPWPYDDLLYLHSPNLTPLHACLTRNSAGNGMEDDEKGLTSGKGLANDNEPKGKAEGGEEIAPSQKLDRVVMDIARLIGRQMAREDFVRLRAAAVNDNEPGQANKEK